MISSDRPIDGVQPRVGGGLSPHATTHPAGKRCPGRRSAFASRCQAALNSRGKDQAHDSPSGATSEGVTAQRPPRRQGRPRGRAARTCVGVAIVRTGGGNADHTTMFGEWEEGHTIFSDIGGNEGSTGVVKADVNHRTYVRAFIHVER